MSEGSIIGLLKEDARSLDYRSDPECHADPDSLEDLESRIRV